MIILRGCGRYIYTNKPHEAFILHEVKEPVHDLEYSMYEGIVLDIIHKVLDTELQSEIEWVSV